MVGTNFNDFQDLHIITYFDCTNSLRVQMLTFSVLLAKFAELVCMLKLIALWYH